VGETRSAQSKLLAVISADLLVLRVFSFIWVSAQMNCQQTVQLRPVVSLCMLVNSINVCQYIAKKEFYQISPDFTIQVIWPVPCQVIVAAGDITRLIHPLSVASNVLKMFARAWHCSAAAPLRQVWPVFRETGGEMTVGLGANQCHACRYSLVFIGQHTETEQVTLLLRQKVISWKQF